MKQRPLWFAAAMALMALVAIGTAPATRAIEHKPLEFGNFSVSLAVKDIQASMAFYEKLDFRQVGGKPEQRWVVMQNGSVKIGLFQGMFERNILSFNPGWTQDRQALKDFQDVRELQQALKARGLVLAKEADTSTQGPAHFMLVDPDGNALLFDQHVPSPRR